MASKYNIKAVKVDTGETVYGEKAFYYLQSSIRAEEAGVRERLRQASVDGAEAAKRSLERDLSKHQYTTDLLRSVKVVKGAGYSDGGYQPGGAGGGGSFVARAVVGQGVPHAEWFFQGTGKYRKDNEGKKAVIKDIYRAKDYGKDFFGPIDPFSYKRKSGAPFIRYFRGQKDNLDIIKSAQRAANRTVREKVRRIS